MALEAFCLASGPSLNPEDAEAVRRWRMQAGDREVLVVNTTFRMAPWADALYAMDRAWWSLHAKEVLEHFRGARVGIIQPKKGGIELQILNRSEFKPFQNSGCGAISLAMTRGARRIYLLGYDCQRTGGKMHWHGDHPKPLGNAGSIDKWHKFFAQVAAFAKVREVEIINCSRQTAIKEFTRIALEEIVPAQLEAA